MGGRISTVDLSMVAWGCIHNTSFSSQLKNKPDKLVLYFTRLERLASYEDWHSGTLVSYEEDEVL
jgi:hypothetical protein